jgi:hypothetical protein
MYEESSRPVPETLEVLLDGQAVQLPAERRSLGAIRTHLEALALENARVLCLFTVDGRPASFPPSPPADFSFRRVEGQTVGLTDMPLRMLETALQETAQARAAIETAVTLVMINEGAVARELWWDLARKLKEPLLTLSLLPETIYQPVAGRASLLQMRKWQLQQLAIILKDVDAACWSTTPGDLSNALEHRILPWLAKLHRTIRLWHQTLLAGPRSQSNWDRDVDQRLVAGA